MISFDNVFHVRSYVQSKGRARAKDGEYYVYIQRGEKNKKAEIEQQEKEMKKLAEQESEQLIKYVNQLATSNLQFRKYKIEGHQIEQFFLAKRPREATEGETDERRKKMKDNLI